VIEGDRVFLEKSPTAPKEHPLPYCVTLREGCNGISQADCEIFMGNSQNAKNVYKNEIRMYLVSDKIVGKLTARNRRAKDAILFHGMHKDVRRLMSEKKLPLAWRDRLPILCDDEGVLAVPGIAVRDGVCAPREAADATTVRICFLSDLTNDFIKNRKG
jgi:tRNA(Ile)-lysidine synthetase-like protein